MRKFLLAAALLSVAAPALAEPVPAAVQKRIDRILRHTPLIDGHNDLPWALREDHKLSVEGLESGTDKRNPPLMTDMQRMRQGRVGGQFWSVYITGTITGDEAIRTTIEQIDTARRLIDAYPEHLRFARSSEEMIRAPGRGRIGSMLGIEGGRQIGGSLAALRRFHDLGARYMTLTHNQTTEWADAATDEPKFDGLSPFGLEVVREMNRLGMLVDLSHVAPATMKDSIAASRAPVIFSHSDAYALNPHPRNVPDDVLRLLPANGGVLMVTFVPGFLSPEAWAWSRERLAQEARLKSLYSFSKARVEQGLKSWEAAHPRPPVHVAAVADHIEHVVGVAGHDHVGLGGDLDGIPYGVEGLDTVAGYPLLFAELIRRGWSDRDLAKLAGGNILRVMRRAEEVAAEMKDVPPSLATLEPQPMTEPSLRAAIVPVTPLQQNCTLLWCTATMKAAFVDPGGDLPRLKGAAAQAGVTIEKILLTHGHIDHCGSAGILAAELGVPIEGPHEADRFWIDRLEEDGQRWGITGKPFEPGRWLKDGDTVTVGDLVLNVRHCPGHTPGHVVFHHPESSLALVGDVLFKGSIGRWDFPMGDHKQLVESITQRLWPMGPDTAFVPGHGPMSTFGHERATNPLVGDRVLAAA